MEFYVGQQKDEWRLHQDYSSLQYEGSFWYLFYGKKDFPDELLHSIEDDGFKAIVAELTPPTIEIVGFLGGAARFITKPCLKQRVMRFPTVRYGCSV